MQSTGLAVGCGITDATVTAGLSATRSSDTVVTLSLAGTATSDTDYTVAGALPSISIPSGSGSADANPVIAPVDDIFWEGATNESILINRSSTGGLAVTGAQLEIDDDDPRPGIDLIPFSADQASEDAGTVATTINTRLTGSAMCHDATEITISIDPTSRATQRAGLLADATDHYNSCGGISGRG